MCWVRLSLLGWTQASNFSCRHVRQPDGSLVITPLRAEDTGTYSCGPGWHYRVELRVMGQAPPLGSHGFQAGWGCSLVQSILATGPLCSSKVAECRGEGAC